MASRYADDRTTIDNHSNSSGSIVLSEDDDDFVVLKHNRCKKNVIVDSDSESEKESSEESEQKSRVKPRKSTRISLALDSSVVIARTPQGVKRKFIEDRTESKIEAPAISSTMCAPQSAFHHGTTASTTPVALKTPVSCATPDDVPYTTPRSPEDIPTPETPYGRKFVEYLFSKTRKMWKKWIDWWPEEPEYKPPPPKERRKSTPMAELIHRCWPKFPHVPYMRSFHTNNQGDSQIEDLDDQAGPSGADCRSLNNSSVDPNQSATSATASGRATAPSTARCCCWPTRPCRRPPRTPRSAPSSRRRPSCRWRRPASRRAGAGCGRASRCPGRCAWGPTRACARAARSVTATAGRSAKGAAWTTTWTPSTRAWPTGCASSTARATSRSRTWRPSSSAAPSSTARCARWRPTRSCWCGTATRSPCSWASRPRTSARRCCALCPE